LMVPRNGAMLHVSASKVVALFKLLKYWVMKKRLYVKGLLFTVGKGNQQAKVLLRFDGNYLGVHWVHQCLLQLFEWVNLEQLFAFKRELPIGH
jgi:hypothetical protein